ncbi:MAG: hypothetical protein RI947_304 [Candidatus Parcubacteria bacterium]
MPAPEPESKEPPILALSQKMGAVFSAESKAALSFFKPRMEEEEKMIAFRLLHDSLQEAETEQTEPEVQVQVRHDIGIVLALAHAHYVSESTWPEMSEELWTAFDLADQNAENYPEFFDTKEEIYAVIKDLAQKQHRV